MLAKRPVLVAADLDLVKRSNKSLELLSPNSRHRSDRPSGKTRGSMWLCIAGSVAPISSPTSAVVELESTLFGDCIT
ncbi:unnamed protein product [Microthlaspi erraticum]|uniref:Uncharacterized protein n=1 Tax=Microthlaspi erraticum TaxID=1685480 RepID=A0A6D2L3C8_9BRAS|nr:unnamed protein product [Microthlaspi erraticum]